MSKTTGEKSGSFETNYLKTCHIKDLPDFTNLVGPARRQYL